ncbi:hypothetical protein TPHA_0M00140 [Tetrapisispora phaffii CBS 4417]|uniref:Uncharacterized protein n=1 Tax=Tetrapisispora phaffii (strain ATCC 24235 / CBS 4417 / NBRC 1672 / NRRL Y-8282 / UCD 70-5) TaxID=1071381 RepID=G8C0T1_TETPH|nr:hypothetical protein TPHA_0M00140 [Tetrapisispora phaffii CBS 4417]CCE65592.1 hypothetical protein TPHA_0M00140 [Tetrapisispora phaffii CBS 4417]
MKGTDKNVESVWETPEKFSSLKPCSASSEHHDHLRNGHFRVRAFTNWTSNTSPGISSREGTFARNVPGKSYSGIATSSERLPVCGRQISSSLRRGVDDSGDERRTRELRIERIRVCKANINGDVDIGTSTLRACMRAFQSQEKGIACNGGSSHRRCVSTYICTVTAHGGHHRPADSVTRKGTINPHHLAPATPGTHWGLAPGAPPASPVNLRSYQ